MENMDKGAFTNYVYKTRQVTPHNSEIICVQNVGTKVVCGIIFLLKENYDENMKKIVGAL
jgi:hypothetical protein